MFVVDHDFYTIKNQKKEAFEQNFRFVYQNYIGKGIFAYGMKLLYRLECCHQLRFAVSRDYT